MDSNLPHNSPTLFFSRPPRRYVLPPTDTVTVQPPPAAITPPTMSIGGLLLPGLGICLSIGLLAVFSRNSSSAGYLLFSVPMMFISVGAGVFNFVAGRRRYQRAVAEREARYRRYLQESGRRLGRLRQDQWEAQTMAHPAQATWVARAQTQDPALWERTSADDDFLTLRLGLGSGPASFTVTSPPPPPIGQDEDPLLSEAIRLAEQYTTAAQTPVVLDFREMGLVAAHGLRAEVLGASRAWLVEAAGAHGPDELHLLLIYPAAEREAWRWARWLPHAQLAAGGRALAETPEAARRQLSDLLEQQRLSAEIGAHTLVVVADLKLLDFSLVRALRAPEAGAVSFLFLVDRAAGAPKDCRALIEVGEGRARLRLVGPPPVEQTCVPDAMEAGDADAFARALAPLRLAGADRVDTAVPARAALFPWLDFSASAIAERWRTARPWETLAAPIGVKAGGAALLLDLHENGHGPHGIVGGTTGSGKSELLQTILAALAACFSPRDLTFLIADFKGEGMSRSVASLPHIVGVLSNIESQTPRALVSLKAELTRRQVQFSQAGVSHIDQYQRLSRAHPEWLPIPRLLIVVDEFAELAATQPECMKDLVSTARLGRSLGVSLLLATQRPAGIISDQIWSNSRYKMCLRVQTVSDSQEVLHRTDAAAISGRTPGRAFFQIGAGEVFEEFQTLYAGSPYRPEQEREAAAAIYAVSETGEQRRLYPPAAMATETGTQLEVLLERISEAAAADKVERLPGLWLSPLPEQLLLRDLPRSAGIAPIVGLIDDPAHQRQTPLQIDLDQHGHLLIAGGPKSGKTTLLMTLVLAMADAADQGETNFYLLDYGNRQLKQLEGLPQVGAVILPDETDRQQRLWRWLDREVDRRRGQLGEAGVANWAAYRQTQASVGAELVLVIDNWPEMAAAWQEAQSYLGRLIRDGASLGIHVIFTVTGATVSYRLLSNLSLILALELADRVDYGGLVGRAEVLPAPGVRGRGLVKGDPVLEFQAALPAPGGDTERAAALRARVEEIKSRYRGRHPHLIRERPAQVLLSELFDGETHAPGQFPVGLDSMSLETVCLSLTDAVHLVITGAAGGGKSSLLRSLALSVAATHTPQEVRFYLANFGPPTLALLADWPHTAAYAAQPDQVHSLLEKLRAEVEARRQTLAQTGAATGEAPAGPRWVLAMDDYDFVPVRAEAEQWLALFQAGLPLGLRVWLASPGRVVGNLLDRIVGAVKSSGTGFIVASSESADLALLGVRLPLAEQGRPVPRGMAILAQPGTQRLVLWASAGNAEAWSGLLRRVPGDGAAKLLEAS